MLSKQFFNKSCCLIVSGFLLAACSKKEEIACTEPRPLQCTEVYEPVCANTDKGFTTRTNECAACSDFKTKSYIAGACD